MFDAFSRIISQADARGEYLSCDQLDAMTKMVAENNKRMDAVNRITSNASSIVANAGRSLLAEQPQLIAPGGSAYGSRRLAACLRDLEIILRYVTYATYMGDASVLEDRCLNALAETYVALGVPGASVAVGVQKMKEAALAIINDRNNITPGDCSALMAEIASYFERVAIAVNFNFPPAKPWEISNYAEWIKQDKLTQKLQQYAKPEDQLLLQKSTKGFFEAFSRMPPILRRGIWHEREVMAALYEQMMNRWKDLPGFRSVAVATRMVDGKNRLVGILVFQSPSFISEELYQKGVPQYLRIESSIGLLSRDDEQEVPILLEWMSDIEDNRDLGTEIPVAPPSPFIPAPTITIQSGDTIAGRNSQGYLNSNSTVTLTTFVISKNTSDLTDFQLLTVHHGFRMGYTEGIYTCEVEPPAKIGELSYDFMPCPILTLKKDCAKKLDVAIIRPDRNCLINPYVKWGDLIPNPNVHALPLPDGTPLLVQMYGGESKKTQIGEIDCTIVYSPGETIPKFTAKINVEFGDSGALLITGHDSSGVPYKEGKGNSLSNYESMKFATLGVLLEKGKGTFGGLAYFRPMYYILEQLDVREYYQNKVG